MKTYINSTAITVNNTNWYSVSATGTSITLNNWADYSDYFVSSDRDDRVLKIATGKEREIRLPDGSVVHVDRDGNFRIEDKNAKVTYRASRSREFNPYVNSGDLLAEFISFLGTIPGVRRGDVPKLPLELFVNWLIIRAAERDDDPVPDGVVNVPDSRLLKGQVRPRCGLPVCRRFIARRTFDLGLRHCNADHAARHHQLIAAA